MRKNYELTKIGYSLSDIGNLQPWERDVYLDWAIEDQKRQQKELSQGDSGR